MNKEHFEKNKTILEEIKAKFPNRIKKLGEPLDDPILSPYYYPFVFLADRDPTTSEPDVYQGYDGLVLVWINQTTNQPWLSTNNLDSTLGWTQSVTAFNLLSILSAVGWQINTTRNYSASGISLNTARQPNLTNDTEIAASIKQVNTLLTSTAVTFEISPNNSTWTTMGSMGVDNGAISSYTTMINFECPAGYYYRIVGSGSGTNTLVSCNELTK